MGVLRVLAVDSRMVALGDNSKRMTETLKVYDDHGFYYEVTLDHKPHYGFSNALYQDQIIGQVELGRMYAPYFGDDDREWEQYEERLEEWKDEIKVNMKPLCEKYFNERR